MDWGVRPRMRQDTLSRDRKGADFFHPLADARGSVCARLRLRAAPFARGSVCAQLRLRAAPFARGSVCARLRLRAAPFARGSVCARFRLQTLMAFAALRTQSLKYQPLF
jgi:hypothetical protein